MTLAEQFLGHRNVTRRLRDGFSKACIDLAQKGCWQTLDLAKAKLAQLGLRFQTLPLTDLRPSP